MAASAVRLIKSSVTITSDNQHTTAEFRDTTRPGWRYEVIWAGGDICSLTINTDDAPPPITSTELRRVPIGDMNRQLRAHRRKVEGSRVGRLLAQIPTQNRARDTSLDQRLAVLAHGYFEARRSGLTIEEFADEVDMPRQTVANRLVLAGKRGVVTPTSQGRKRQGLTPYGRSLLDSL